MFHNTTKIIVLSNIDCTSKDYNILKKLLCELTNKDVNMTQSMRLPIKEGAHAFHFYFDSYDDIERENSFLALYNLFQYKYKPDVAKYSTIKSTDYDVYLETDDDELTTYYNMLKSELHNFQFKIVDYVLAEQIESHEDLLTAITTIDSYMEKSGLYQFNDLVLMVLKRLIENDIVKEKDIEEVFPQRIIH